MSVASISKEKAISTANISASYCKNNHLYLIFREVIDPDMVPLPEDFSVVDRARSVTILDTYIVEEGAQPPILVLQLKDQVMPGSELGLQYSPQQWFMCWAE